MTATIDAPLLPTQRRPEFAPVVVRRLPPPGPSTELGAGSGAEPDEPLPMPEPPEIPGDPKAEVQALLRLIMEILDGRRACTQLGGRLSPMAMRYLVAARTRLSPSPDRRVAAPRGRHGPPGVRTVRLSYPADRAAEVSAVWQHRGRVRALAARFEWSGGRWRCTALRLG